MTTAKAVVVQQIALADLLIAPWNARKTFDAAALNELAASIKEHGVQVPLLVRQLETPEGWNDGPRWEIVAGHRRYEAAKRAGLGTLPCIVRELTDEQAREVGLVDNLQREDLAPLDEAAGFRELLSKPGATIESVAAALGKSASYVGRRLKLLDAIEPVREALWAGAIEVGHALELARLSPSQQGDLLDWLEVGWQHPFERDEEGDSDNAGDDEFESGVCRYCGCSDDDACRLENGETCHWLDLERTVCSNPECAARWNEDCGLAGWRPARFTLAQLRAEIGRRTLKVLSDAPFPLDAEIPPTPCASCPKRAGNAALLFDDCAQDTCTDRGCYDGKIRAWIRRELEESPKLLKLSDGYSDDRTVIGDYEVVLVSEPCEHQEEAIWIDGKRAGHRVTICREQKCKIHHAERRYFSDNAGHPEKAKAKRKKLLAKVKAEKTYRAALFKAIAIAPGDNLHQAFGSLVTQLAAYAIRRSDSTKYATLAEATGIPKDAFRDWSGKQLQEQLASRPAWVQAMIGLLATESSALTVHEYNLQSGTRKLAMLGLEKLADLAGVDWKALRAQRTAAKKSAVKPAKKKTILDGATRARRAAVQKKRWAEQRKVAQKTAKPATAKKVRKGRVPADRSSSMGRKGGGS